MSDLVSCTCCGELAAAGTCVCPHCGASACRSRGLPKAALLLGLSLAACGGKEDTAETDTGTITAQPLYGTAATGMTSRAEAAAPELAEHLVVDRASPLARPTE